MCNLEMKLCEKGTEMSFRALDCNIGVCFLVDPDKVGWFVFDFELQTDLFQDARFVQAFKK